MIPHTDNIALHHWTTAPNLSPRVIRWLADVESFNIDFEHILGTSNTAADALSRLCPMIASDSDTSWMADYKADPLTFSQYFAPDGFLLPTTDFKHGRIWRVDRVIVPASRVQEVIRNHHSSVLARHWNSHKTRHLVERRHSFHGLPASTEKFVECCEICQRTKSREHVAPKPPQGDRAPRLLNL